MVGSFDCLVADADCFDCQPKEQRLLYLLSVLEILRRWFIKKKAFFPKKEGLKKKELAMSNVLVKKWLLADLNKYRIG